MAQVEEQAAPERPGDSPGPSGFRSKLDRPGLRRLAELGQTLARATVENPVLVKEFRTRMRGTRAYWMLLGYVLLLSGVLAIMYFGHEVNTATDVGMGAANVDAVRELGRWIYYFVFIAQAIMVALITPAITAGTVTIEREQRAYELLVTTTLRSIDLIRGKLTAAVAFVVLLLTVSLPLVSLSFLVGGVSPAEIFFSYLIIALSAFVYGSIGIFWSAALRTTAAATVVTYLTVLAFFLLTGIPGAVRAEANRGIAVASEIPFQSLNPISATFWAVHPEHFFGTQLPGWIGAAVLNLLLGMLIANAALARLEHFEPPRPFWTRFLATLYWCAFCLFLFGPLFGGFGTGWTTRGAMNPFLSIVLPWMLVMVTVVTPIFNSGDLIIRRGENAVARYLSGFLPHRMFGNDLSCGFPLVFAWALFLFALIPIGAASIGRSAALPMQGLYLPAVALCLAVIFGLAGIGNLLSVVIPSRWAACVLTYLTAVLLMLLPYFTLLPWYQTTLRSQKPQLLWQVLYLIPFEGLFQLTEKEFYLNNRPPLILGPSVPVWIVTTTVYVAVGALCFLITLARVRDASRRVPSGRAAPAQEAPAT